MDVLVVAPGRAAAGVLVLGFLHTVDADGVGLLERARNLGGEPRFFRLEGGVGNLRACSGLEGDERHHVEGNADRLEDLVVVAWGE
jgi:hypothetical protein